MKIFETKNELQQAKLTEDQLVQIKGGTTANDGQTNFYYIRTPAQFGGTPDEVNDLTLANGNIAELMTGQTRFQNNQLQIWNGNSYEGVKKQRNYITDGRFDFWFQGTVQTSNGYGSDTMWLNLNDGSTKTHTQEKLTIGVDLPAVDNPTAEFYSRTVVNSVAGASNNVIKLQRIESVRSLAGKKANLSLYAKADSTKNIAFEFVQNFGTGGSPSTRVTGISVNKFEITASWARYDFPVDIPSISGKTLGTDGNDNLAFIIWFDAGSDFDSRTDSLGQQSGTFDIACVQLTEGETVYKFEEEDFQNSLDKVNRYYIFYAGTSDLTFYAFGTCQNTTIANFHIELDVEMRSFPALDANSGTGGSGFVVTDTSSILASNVTPVVNEETSSGNKYMSIVVSGVFGLVQFRPVYLQNDAASGQYLAFDARL